VKNKLRSLMLLLLFCHVGMAAQTKRALLIGIDEYARPIALPEASPKASMPLGLQSETSRWEVPVWHSLEGAVNDVQAVRGLLTSAKFGFPGNEPYMKVLINGQATREAILGAMQRYLVDLPVKGDTVVFYYAGHGSQRFNSRTSKPNHLDETIVPSDVNAGAFDVRDKEIARIINHALDKGVKLTAILDSCHSGSITRGIPMGSSGMVRFLGYDPRDANDPDDNTVRPEDRRDNAALVFTATQHDQFAREWEFQGEHHGAFTIALIEALRALPANIPAADVYKRVKVVMQGMGLADQQPSLGGAAARPHDALFGASSNGTRMRVAVAREGTLDNGKVVLDAGRIAGIGKGSELVKVVEPKRGPELRLRVVGLEGMNKAVAEPVGANGEKIEAGDLFELDKWVPADENRLQVWMPPATLSSADLEDFVAELSALRDSPKLKWLDDPSSVRPTHILSWTGTEWILSHKGGEQVSLGAHPAAQDVLNKLASSSQAVSLFIDIPPSKELAAQVKLGEDANAAVEIMRRPQLATYVLIGRLQGGHVEYAWMLKEVIEQGKTADAQSVCSADTSFPLRTDWTAAAPRTLDTAGREITEFAAMLAKIKLWLGLRVPPGGGDSGFPYVLALKRRGAGESDYLEGGHVIQNEVYDLVLHTSDSPPAHVDRQWVYVLGIDCTGRGRLLYPFGDEGNQLPEKGSIPKEITLTSGKQGIRIVPPFGLDSYVLLITSEQLPDPNMLDFDAVLTRGSRGPTSPLSELLSSASSGKRGMDRPVPSDWTIRYLQVTSVGQAPATK